MPRTPKAKTAAKDSTASLGFEAISLIGGVPPLSEMFLQILCLAEGNDRVGDKESRSKDILGRVCEPSEARQTARSAARRGSAANQYFLTQFASAEGKNGGQSSGARKTATVSPQGERGGVHQFYTPSCDVRLLVEMLAPYKGRIYDLACGSSGMFVQSEKFVESQGGKLGDISVYGQESYATTRRLAKPLLALDAKIEVARRKAATLNDLFRTLLHELKLSA